MDRPIICQNTRWAMIHAPESTIAHLADLSLVLTRFSRDAQVEFAKLVNPLFDKTPLVLKDRIARKTE